MNSPSERSELTVIIPAKDEAENLLTLLPSLRDTLRGLPCRTDILVADGGSSDDTAGVLGRLGVAMFRQESAGYGGALREAFKRVIAPYVVTMDADYSHPPRFIHQLWAARGTADLVIASRYVPGGRAQMPVVRLVLSRVLNRIYARFLRLPYRDLSSGFRLYRRAALQDIGELTSSHFEVLQEISIKLHGRGRRIREIPFHYAPRKEGKSKARIFRFGAAHLRSLRKMWILRNTRK
ncbi:MAG: glycosyltransferase [Nitrospirae bacterium]|nr:glycosyltransferase [Nitrospirota bacterium]